jgi:hypothetical protein
VQSLSHQRKRGSVRRRGRRYWLVTENPGCD